MPPAGQADREGEGNEQTKPINRVNRTQQLSNVRDWCMGRISNLSLENRINDARAITSEHMELLEKIDAYTTLWMIVERTKP